MTEGLTRRVAVVAIGRGAGSASIFAVNALLTRAWSGPEFGLFSTVWVLANTLVPVFLIGLPTGLLYFFPRRVAEKRRGLVTQAASCLLISGLILGAMLWLAGPCCCVARPVT